MLNRRRRTNKQCTRTLRHIQRNFLALDWLIFAVRNNHECPQNNHRLLIQDAENIISGTKVYEQSSESCKIFTSILENRNQEKSTDMSMKSLELVMHSFFVGYFLINKPIDRQMQGSFEYSVIINSNERFALLLMFRK